MDAQNDGDAGDDHNQLEWQRAAEMRPLDELRQEQNAPEFDENFDWNNNYQFEYTRSQLVMAKHGCQIMLQME